MRILTIAQMFDRYPKKDNWDEEQLLQVRMAFYGGIAIIFDTLFGKGKADFAEDPSGHMDVFQSELKDFGEEVKRHIIKDMFGDDLPPVLQDIIIEVINEEAKKHARGEI